MYVPASEPVLQVIEQRLLHHIRDLITLQRWTDQHDRPHGWYNVVRCGRFLKS